MSIDTYAYVDAGCVRQGNNVFGERLFSEDVDVNSRDGYRTPLVLDCFQIRQFVPLHLPLSALSLIAILAIVARSVSW